MAERIVADLNRAVQQCKVVLKSGQEPSIVDMQHDVMRKRTEQGMSTSLQNGPVGDGNNNGRTEKVVREFGGVARTLMSTFEERIGSAVSLSLSLCPWFVCQAANVLNRYQIRSSGSTAYNHAIGRDSIIPVCEFVEYVHSKPPKISQPQMPDKFDTLEITRTWSARQTQFSESEM